MFPTLPLALHHLIFFGYCLQSLVCGRIWPADIYFIICRRWFGRARRHACSVRALHTRLPLGKTPDRILPRLGAAFVARGRRSALRKPRRILVTAPHTSRIPLCRQPFISSSGARSGVLMATSSAVRWRATLCGALSPYPCDSGILATFAASLSWTSGLPCCSSRTHTSSLLPFAFCGAPLCHLPS